MRISYFSFAILFLLGMYWVPVPVQGQASEPKTTPKPANAYALEPLVIEHTDTRYRMAADGTGICERTVSARVQSEGTLKQLSVLTLPFASKSEHVEWVYARVKHADGSVTETPLTGSMEIVEPVTREAPFYSDLKQVQLPLRDLRVGDTVEWKAKTVRTSAEAPGEFWGQESFIRDGVVLSQTLELEIPRDKIVNVWSPKSKPTESVAGDLRVYSWQSDQKKPTVGAEADAAKEIEKKRVRTADEELDLREGKLPDVAWTSFKSWEAVGAWYRGMEGNRMVPDAEIKAKVAQVTVGKTTDLEKVQAVYSYVATQIHYIGVAFGIGRYQPHSAADVLQNQYGDCKDKHTLLAAMLSALGFQPDAVLIGAGIRFNPAVPSPSAFNHLITRVQVNGKPVWLDSTAEVAPYGMLIYVTRDHDALVIPETAAAQVVKTPARPPFDPMLTMESVGTLDTEGTSTSRLTFTFRGDDEVILRSVLRQVSPAQYDQVAQQMCSSMGYTGTASHMEVSKIEDTAEPLKLSFDYKREKAGDWPNYRTIPQVSPVTLFRPDVKEPPVQAIALGVPRVETSHAAMKLPEGWKVEFPEAVHEKSPYATYDQTYRFDKGTMYTDRRVEVLEERVPVADWKTYSKFVEKADLGNEQYIQLVRSSTDKASSATTASSKTTDAGSASAPPATSGNNAEAQKLLQDALQALQASDFSSAGGLLDQAKAINPTQPGLWSAYGFLSFRKGEMRSTVDNLQKELSLHPANTAVYPMLIQTQLALKEKDPATANLRKWALADPADVRPVLQLGQMQMSDGDPKEAVKIFEAALAATPAGDKKNEQLELQLGMAQLKSGEKAKGDATLATLLKETDNPDMMNNAAYELADAGLELPLAEQTTRTALNKMEQESVTWTLDESQATLRGRTQMMQATWDTMGWIYFRGGKVTEAEGYLNAAWRGRQDAEVAKHLAEVAITRGDKNAALTDYELGLATYTNYDMMGAHTEPGPAQKQLMASAEALRKTGARSTITDARAALQKMRSIPLGAAAGMKGVAEYKMLVSRGTVLRVEQSGSKSVTGAEERLKNAKLSGFIPPHSPAQLVFVGMVNCHSDVCELMLEP